MKTRLFLFAFCLALVTAGSVFFAQSTKNPSVTPPTYDYLWKTVEQSEKASLPKSALETINEIYMKALKGKNGQQLIKSLIYRMKMELAIDNDKFPQIIVCHLFLRP